MAVLIDTSVLGRLANQADVDFLKAEWAIAELHRRGEALYLTGQNLVEFRNFATRPVKANGLGLSAAAASNKAAVFEATFPMLDETPAIYPAWRTLADTFGVIGKQVHDLRLVAVCHVHRIDKVLTFNTSHFARFASAPPGIVVIDAAAP